MSEENKERVRRCVAEVGNVDEGEVADDDSLSDLGLDSIDRVDVVMEVEQEFEIRISDEQAEKINTVADIYAVVEELTS